MALRVKPIPYVYDSAHDINDVIRQYNDLSPRHSKIKRLRDEFDKINKPPFSHGQTLQIPVLTAALKPHDTGKFKLENVAPPSEEVQTIEEKPEPVKPQKPQKLKPPGSDNQEIPLHLRPEYQIEALAVGTGTPLTPDKKDIRLLGGKEIRPGYVLRNGSIFKIVDLRDEAPVQCESMLKEDK